MSTLMGGSRAAAVPPVANPEVTYQVQLQQLNDMGFYDGTLFFAILILFSLATENVRALQATGGNVEGAVEYLFSNPPPGRH